VSRLEISQRQGRGRLPDELDLLAQLLEDRSPGEAPGCVLAPRGASGAAGPALQRHAR
jgi:hypothetical protein